jgi:hypothetical protein
LAAPAPAGPSRHSLTSRILSVVAVQHSHSRYIPLFHATHGSAPPLFRFFFHPPSWYIKRGSGAARASEWARSRRLGRSWRLCFDPAQEGTGRRKRRQKRARARAQRERTRERASERGRGAETKKSEVTRRENPQGRDAPQNVSRTSCTLVRAYARLGGTLLVSECEDSGARV